ncbi:MAG: nucleotide exchange factor GrpE [Anaerolineaceae bacterium]|jgi:molecular chaperone GrpE|nr:nucleotide exchange factor GrpE [Anaerolineaceae bacterium]
MPKKYENKSKAKKRNGKPSEEEKIPEQNASHDEVEPNDMDDLELTPEDAETDEEESIRMIMLPAKEVEKLNQDLAETQELAEKNFDGWQRERADFLNYKKHIERGREQALQNITGETIKKYLPVLDDIELALKNRPVEETAGSWREGIDLIHRKLQVILESEGATRIPAEKEIFDPTRHEAITCEESSEHESGEIIEVIKQGYMLNDRVLRPALVRVAK